MMSTFSRIEPARKSTLKSPRVREIILVLSAVLFNIARAFAPVEGISSVAPAGTLAEATQQRSHSEIVRCRRVSAGGPVLFHGKTLVEAPDIKNVELRHANALISHRCREEAIDIFKKFVDAYPSDYHVAFIRARLAWTDNDGTGAAAILAQVLEDHPDFLSAQLLQASQLISQGHYEQAATMLDALSLRSPSDLWVMVDKLRLEAIRSPSTVLRDTLLEISRHPGFPPSAREVASDTGRHLPNLTRDQFEAFYWADLQYESATPMACKIHNLAFLLSEDGGRFAQARQLLESPAAATDVCVGVESNKMLLAQAYLMEAASIDARPSPRNAALIAKAHAVLGGDWSELARHVIGRPQFDALQPFLAGTTAPSDRDQFGRTPICNAVMLSHVSAVQAQLDLGADPKGDCDGRSLIEYLILTANDRTGLPMQQIAGLLLAQGVRPTPAQIESCRDPASGPFCARYLLPLF